jgi:hypothetical protein
MPRISKFFAGLIIATALLAPVFGAFAQVMQQAFMVIRFNQPRVYFDQQLYNAVAKAVGLKPEVMFDLVSYAPRTGEPQMDKQWQDAARKNLALVTARMNALGVPSSRLTVVVESQAGLRYNEVHLFAR